MPKFYILTNLILTTNLAYRYYYYSHFTDGETEAKIKWLTQSHTFNSARAKSQVFAVKPLTLNSITTLSLKHTDGTSNSCEQSKSSKQYFGAEVGKLSSTCQIWPTTSFCKLNFIRTQSVAAFASQEQSNYDRDCITCKAKNIYYLALAKSFLTLVFEDIMETLLWTIQMFITYTFLLLYIKIAAATIY